MNSETLMLNPKIDKKSKDSFETNIFEMNKNVKMNKSVWVRAVIDKFNSNPDKFMKFLKSK